MKLSYFIAMLLISLLVGSTVTLAVERPSFHFEGEIIHGGSPSVAKAGNEMK